MPESTVQLNPIADAAEHWCGWCRENPQHAAPADWSAISFCYIRSSPGREHAMIYGQPSGPALHLHDLAIVDPAHLTIRAAVHRAFRRRFKVGGIRLSSRLRDRPLQWLDQRLDPTSTVTR